MPDIAEPPAPPAPTTSITVSTMPASATPAEPPKPGSARERLFSELRQKAKPTGSPAATPPPKPEPQTKPSQAPSHPGPAEEQGGLEDGESGGGEPERQPETAPAPAGDKPDITKPTTPEERKKVSPWKLVDQLKKDLVEARKTNALPEKERTELMDRASKAEQRIKEMEDELRWYNTEKYDPDVKKAAEDYDRAWSIAMDDLKELTVTDSQGERPIAPQDLLELVNLPLSKAREIASNLYGAFADDVMAHRKEIRRLFESKQLKMDDLRKTAGEREKQRAEAAKRFQEESSKLIKETWDKASETIKADPKFGRYFSPVEGNDEINQRLERGYQLVDRAFSENPLDPNLTPEQRATVVKHHAAIRHRAASWGRIVYENQQLTKENEALKKELGQFKSSQPTTGGVGGSTAPAAPVSAKDSLFAELRKRAH